MNALDKTWHPACFVCAECGCAISSGAFHVEDGLPYCMKGKADILFKSCLFKCTVQTTLNHVIDRVFFPDILRTL